MLLAEGGLALLAVGDFTALAVTLAERRSGSGKPIGGPTPATRELAPVKREGLATIARRQQGGDVGGERDRQTRSGFIERADRPDLTGVAGIDRIGVEYAPRRQPCLRRDIDQMQAVVFAQLQGRHQERRLALLESRSRGREARERGHIDRTSLLGQAGTRAYEIEGKCGRHRQLRIDDQDSSHRSPPSTDEQM